MSGHWLEQTLFEIRAEDISVKEMYDLLEEAMEYHKRDVINAYNSGYKDAELDYGHDVDPDISEYSNAENYYKQITNNENNN